MRREPCSSTCVFKGGDYQRFEFSISVSGKEIIKLIGWFAIWFNHFFMNETLLTLIFLEVLVSRPIIFKYKNRALKCRTVKWLSVNMWQRSTDEL